VPEGSAKFAELLKLLSSRGIDFIVVGGVRATFLRTVGDWGAGIGYDELVGRTVLSE
jgi:hypothetical protein